MFYIMFTLFINLKASDLDVFLVMNALIIKDSSDLSKENLAIYNKLISGISNQEKNAFFIDFISNDLNKHLIYVLSYWNKEQMDKFSLIALLSQEEFENTQVKQFVNEMFIKIKNITHNCYLIIESERKSQNKSLSKYFKEKKEEVENKSL